MPESVPRSGIEAKPVPSSTVFAPATSLVSMVPANMSVSVGTSPPLRAPERSQVWMSASPLPSAERKLPRKSSAKLVVALTSAPPSTFEPSKVSRLVKPANQALRFSGAMPFCITMCFTRVGSSELRQGRLEAWSP